MNWLPRLGSNLDFDFSHKANRFFSLNDNSEKIERRRTGPKFGLGHRLQPCYDLLKDERIRSITLRHEPGRSVQVGCCLSGRGIAKANRYKLDNPRLGAHPSANKAGQPVTLARILPSNKSGSVRACFVPVVPLPFQFCSSYASNGPGG